MIDLKMVESSTSSSSSPGNSISGQSQSHSCSRNPVLRRASKLGLFVLVQISIFTFCCRHHACFSVSGGATSALTLTSTQTGRITTTHAIGTAASARLHDASAADAEAVGLNASQQQQQQKQQQHLQDLMKVHEQDLAKLQQAEKVKLELQEKLQRQIEANRQMQLQQQQQQPQRPAAATAAAADPKKDEAFLQRRVRDASTWKVLDATEVERHFAPHERQGLVTRNCGNVNEASLWKNKSGWERWMGNKWNVPADFKFYQSNGPCCASGNPHNWIGVPLNKTTPLTHVEVTKDGHQVGPFQMKELLKVLHRTKHHPTTNDTNNNTNTTTTTNTNSAALTIWIQGDSTMSQLWVATFCAIVRLGATIDRCYMNGGHIFHPLCTMLPKNNPSNDLSTNTTDNVDHQRAFFTLPSSLFDKDDNDNSTDRTTRAELRFFTDVCFCQSSAVPTPRCQAYDQRFLNLVQRLPEPDIFLVNHGLHFGKVQTLRTAMQRMLDLLQPLFPSKLVWRETSLQHFPDLGQTGNCEEHCQQVTKLKNNLNVNCADVWNVTHHWRQSEAELCLHELGRHQNNRTTSTTNNNEQDPPRPVVPILRMNNADLHNWETHAEHNPDFGRADCTHRMHAPLCYDSLCWRLSMLLQEQHDEEQRQNQQVVVAPS